MHRLMYCAHRVWHPEKVRGDVQRVQGENGEVYRRSHHSGRRRGMVPRRSRSPPVNVLTEHNNVSIRRRSEN